MSARLSLYNGVGELEVKCRCSEVCNAAVFALEMARFHDFSLNLECETPIG